MTKEILNMLKFGTVKKYQDMKVYFWFCVNLSAVLTKVLERRYFKSTTALLPSERLSLSSVYEADNTLTGLEIQAK